MTSSEAEWVKNVSKRSWGVLIDWAVRGPKPLSVWRSMGLHLAVLLMRCDLVVWRLRRLVSGF